jgi:hypothetical protein
MSNFKYKELSMNGESKKDYQSKLIICFHCGNETPMERVGAYTWGSSGGDEFQFDYTYELFKCPVCSQPTLLEIYGDEDMSVDPDMTPRETALYPSYSIDANAVPVEIAKSYEAALRVKGIDSGICAIALRKTLEMMLVDKGAEGRNLAEKITFMAEQGTLPESLKEASDISRLLGNEAAHSAVSDLDKFDIEYITGFIGHILEYLYIIPNKLDGFKQWKEAKKRRAETVSSKVPENHIF